MARSPFVLFALLGFTSVAVACGSSSGTTGTATSAGSGGKTSTASTSKAASTGTNMGAGAATSSTTSSTAATTGTGGMATTSTTTGTGGMPGDGGQTCQEMCISMNPMAAQKFEGYELKECACSAPTDPCNGMCTAECMNPSTLMQSSPCGMCLLGQANMGTGSTCTVTAGLNDCSGDPMCAPFIQCVLACP